MRPRKRIELFTKIKLVAPLALEHRPLEIRLVSGPENVVLPQACELRNVVKLVLC